MWQAQVVAVLIVLILIVAWYQWPSKSSLAQAIKTSHVGEWASNPRPANPRDYQMGPSYVNGVPSDSGILSANGPAKYVGWNS